ncbi:SET domain-containing protein SmydA-8-like isoform X2 [Phymastichus coffea]|uniref:SET domain-containing protein SmydA-8-like isoform X2 n=1 Tax=Phymastichus coffea TaxID=108790 RepID=UPI00273C3879|nr:SET domain-containing protein SmydA-8-like isoform X2 [Phymastichus coffea]
MERKTRCDKAQSDKYTIGNSKKLGRHMLAAKNLSPGEVILREEPLAVGSDICDEPNICCFGCMRSLSDFRNGKPRYCCSKCNVAPLCSKICEDAIGFHAARECNVFREKQASLLNNLNLLARVLLHLRLWLLKDEDDGVWNSLMSMEAHLNERRNTAVWKDCETRIVNVFKKFSLYAPTEHNQDESLQKLCGIVDVNTFELRSPAGPIGIATGITKGGLRGLFRRAALMAHSCRPNAHISVDEHFRMTVYAALPLTAGDLITFNYTSSLVGTASRQDHLQVGKYFRCQCDACTDPLENGTYLSCLVCPRCRKSYVAMQKPLDLDPYDQKTKWVCQKCKSIFYGCLIRTTITLANQLIDQVDESDQKKMEKLLKKLSLTFHANHYLMLCLKQKILAVYRNELTSINPQKKTLEKMLAMERELLEVLEIVEPGISRLKGILLYEMHLPIAILAKRGYTSRQLSAQELLSQLEDSHSCLKRSLTMLLLEPINTPEGQLAKRALQDLKIVAQSVADAKALSENNTRDKIPKKQVAATHSYYIRSILYLGT